MWDDRWKHRDYPKDHWIRTHWPWFYPSKSSRKKLVSMGSASIIALLRRERNSELHPFIRYLISTTSRDFINYAQRARRLLTKSALFPLLNLFFRSDTLLNWNWTMDWLFSFDSWNIFLYSLSIPVVQKKLTSTVSFELSTSLTNLTKKIMLHGFGLRNH